MRAPTELYVRRRDGTEQTSKLTSCVSYKIIGVIYNGYNQDRCPFDTPAGRAAAAPTLSADSKETTKREHEARGTTFMC